MTLSINDTQHNNIVIMMSVFMHFIYYYAECRYAECHYTEWLYAECRGALKNIKLDWNGLPGTDLQPIWPQRQ